MNFFEARFTPWILLLLLFCSAVGGGEAGEQLLEGSEFQIRGKKFSVTKLQDLPYVESEYTRRFNFDSAENPKLAQLRKLYRLEEVIAPGGSEFERQVLLMDWVHNRFTRFGQPSTSARGALEILNGIEQGHTFFCTQYAQLFASAAASLGWVDRVLALRRHQGVSAGGSTEHSTTEIWSNQYGKWVMLDPTSNMYLEKNGIPLNAYEIRQEWFYNAGRDLVFVIGREQRRYQKKDLPIFLRRFASFGDLRVDPDELDKYGFIGYIPNTDLMDSGFDYAGMFIVKDELCAGTEWHTRLQPKNPAADAYFPIGQVAIELRPGENHLQVELKTFTPNFKEFQVEVAAGEWRESKAAFKWQLQPGENRLRARAINQFGVTGPVSVVEVTSEE